MTQQRNNGKEVRAKEQDAGKGRSSVRSGRPPKKKQHKQEGLSHNGQQAQAVDKSIQKTVENSRKNTRRRGGRGNRRSRTQSNDSRFAPVHKEHEVMFCILCKEAIKDPLAAIGFRDSGDAAHFDCIVKRLNAAENLDKNEKIVYVGGGNFAVVVFTDKKGGAARFEIKRKIDYEQSVKPLIDAWRKDYAVTPAFIVAAVKTCK
jgi:hypothetical protein